MFKQLANSFPLWGSNVHTEYVAKSFQLFCCDYYIMQAIKLILFLYHPKSS